MDPFVAEIRVFAFNFAPTGWAFCNGQLLPISQNTALFSLLGTTYGGDGRSTFALPNLQGRVAIHQNQGPGLSERFLGESGGADSVTLLQSEIPSHNHLVACAPANSGQSNNAANNLPGHSNNAVNLIYNAQAPNTQFNPQAITVAGGNQPHNNDMPTLVLNICIALQGIFPSRG